MFSEILINKNLSIAEISKNSGIPRSTFADLVKGKTCIEKMSAGNLYRLSRYLGINMQDLYTYCNLPGIDNTEIFIEAENQKIISQGLKAYVKYLSDNNLVETCYAFGDQTRLKKYMTAIRDFCKYRKLQLPERYVDYMVYLED